MTTSTTTPRRTEPADRDESALVYDAGCRDGEIASL